MDNVDCSFQKDEIIILAKFIYICTDNSTVSFFFWDTVSTKRQHVIPGYQILIFDNFILIIDYCAVPTLHVTILLLHLVVLLFFVIFDGSILTL